MEGGRAAAHTAALLWGESGTQSVPGQRGDTAGGQRTSPNPPLPVAPGARLELFLFFFLLLSSSLLCHKQGFANSTAPRGHHTNQLTSSDECGQCALLHCMLWSKNTSVVFYLPVHLLLCCYCSLFTGLHTYRMCLFSELSLPPTLLSWSPHTLQLLCLSCRKRRGKERERERHPSHLSQTEGCNELRERECVFCLGIPIAAGRMMSWHPQLTSVLMFPHVKRPSVCAHDTPHPRIISGTPRYTH